MYTLCIGCNTFWLLLLISVLKCIRKCYKYFYFTIVKEQRSTKYYQSYLSTTYHNTFILFQTDKSVFVRNQVMRLIFCWILVNQRKRNFLWFRCILYYYYNSHNYYLFDIHCLIYRINKRGNYLRKDRQIFLFYRYSIKTM